MIEDVVWFYRWTPADAAAMTVPELLRWRRAAARIQRSLRG